MSRTPLGWTPECVNPGCPMVGDGRIASKQPFHLDFRNASHAARCVACHGVLPTRCPYDKRFTPSEVSLLNPFVFCSAAVGGRVQGSPNWSANRHHRKNGLALAFRKARRARRPRRSISQLAVSKIEATL